MLIILFLIHYFNITNIGSLREWPLFNYRFIIE